MVLVDTCIFIDFLRGKNLPEFEKLIKSGNILLSSIVRLELLQGARTNEIEKLSRILSGFQEVSLDSITFQIAEELLAPLKSKGLTVGVPDLLIAAQAIQNRSKLFTSDQFFLKVQKIAWSKVKIFH